MDAEDRIVYVTEWMPYNCHISTAGFYTFVAVGGGGGGGGGGGMAGGSCEFIHSPRARTTMSYYTITS